MPQEKEGILVLELTYCVSKGTYTCKGNVKKATRADLITGFLRTQIGAGKDDSEATDKDIYNIRVECDLSADSFSCSSDTGNKGLRDGILATIAGLMSNKAAA